MAESNLLEKQVQGYTLTKKLGKGGYGTVYLGVKEELGKQYQTAIKYIKMPDSEVYDAVLQEYNYDKVKIQNHFEKIVADITSEIDTLLELSKKDNRYIVSYYDHYIQKTIDPLSFEIFMRMEYLTPLSRHIRKNGLTVGDIISIGLNMCDALILCHNNGIMHRDIKEANMFVSDTGNYKLGDFGVAKVAFETTQADSMKGTASYMAPEIYLHEAYDKTVDIYSLGIVLYKLLNNQRLPFMPDAPTVFTADDKNIAEAKRLKGNTPPLPINAKNKLGKIIVRACLDKSKRYPNAMEFKKTLSKYMASMSSDEYKKIVVTQESEGDESDHSDSDYSNIDYTQTQGVTMTMGAKNNQFVIESTSLTQQNPYAISKSKKKKRITIVSFVLAGLILALVISLNVFDIKIKDVLNKFNPSNNDNLIQTKTDADDILDDADTNYLEIAEIKNADILSRFENAIKDNDIITALTIYRDEIDGFNIVLHEEAEKIIDYHVESIWNSYITNDISYGQSFILLEEIKKLNIISDEKLETIFNEINEIYKSRAAYEKAKEALEIDDYTSAIIFLNNVIPADHNYLDAQKDLAMVYLDYKAEVIDISKDYANSRLYNDSIIIIRKALEILPDDETELLLLISEYEDGIINEINEVINSTESMISGDDYTYENYNEAYNILSNALQKYPDNNTIKEKITEIVVYTAHKMNYDDKLSEAISILTGAFHLMPNNIEIESILLEYDKNERLKVVYNDALNKINSREYESAIINLHNVINQDHNYTDVETYNSAKEIFKEAIEEYRKQIIEFSEDKSKESYEEAILIIIKALDIVPDDEVLKGRLDDFTERKRIVDAKSHESTVENIINVVKIKVSEDSDYISAINDLHDAILLYPENELLETTLNNMKSDYINNEINREIAILDNKYTYEIAIINLNELYESYQNDIGINDAINHLNGEIVRLKNEFINIMITEAEEWVKDSNYIKAIDVLDNIPIWIDDYTITNIQSIIEEYKRKLPILLSDSKTNIKNDDIKFTETTLDNLQNERINVYLGYKKPFKSEYELNDKYIKLTGVFFQPNDNKNDNNKTYLKIFGDGELLASYEMQAGVPPIEINIDLEGVKKLSITLSFDKKGLFNKTIYGYGSLSNMMLHYK